MVFNTEKLNEVLVANWTKILDFKKIGATAIQYANQEIGINISPIKTISCSRFDIKNENFIIWLEISL